jgi:membrane protein
MRRSPLALLKQTVAEWQKDNVPTQAAALAYYTVFALAPLLLVILAVAGLFTSADAARDRLLSEIGGLIGADGAAWLKDLLTRASASQGSGIVSVILGTGGLLLGASGAFGQLQQALNKIWDTTPPANIGALVRARAVSFGLVLVLSFLLLVSLTVSAALSGLGARLGLEAGTGWLWGLLYEVLSASLIAFLFSLIYRFLPDAPVRWRDALIGGLFTSVLFSIGKTLIGLYLGRSAAASVFGAAGTLAVLLVWVYYAAQIVLFGAEFTQVYAQRDAAQGSETPAAVTTKPSPVSGELQTITVHAQVTRERLESLPALRLAAGAITLLAFVFAWRSKASVGGRVWRSLFHRSER